MKHIVSIVYSDPSHELMSMKGRTKSTNYVVEARNPSEAQLRASSYFRSMGYKIHSAVVNEQKEEAVAPAVLKEEAEQVDEANLENKAKKKEFVRQVGLKAMAAGKVDPARGHIPQRAGREELRKEEAVQAETQYIEEKLKASDGVDAWIHDFVHSDNPKFEGKSKKERIQQALGAYYAAKREGSTNEEMKPYVKAAQAKFDAQSKAQNQKPVQAGTLAAKARREGHVSSAMTGHVAEEAEKIDEAISKNESEWRKSVKNKHGSDVSFDYISSVVPHTFAYNAKTKLVGKYNHHKKDGTIREEADQPDPSNILAVIKAAAKSKTLAKQASPKIELGLSKDNPVNAKGPKDEDITEAVEKEEKGSKKEALNKEVDNSKTEVAKAEKEQDAKKKQKPKVTINPDGGSNLPHIGNMSISGTSGGMPGA